jgi:hypothetical protein
MQIVPVEIFPLLAKASDLLSLHYRSTFAYCSVIG